MSRPRRGSGRGIRQLAGLFALACGAGLLTACGANAESGPPTLIWYTNPDTGGQAAVAANCSTDEYTIRTEVLPQDASQQRIQLIRRLAAHDTAIDLMSLDPPFTAEFAEAGYLADLPEELEQEFSEQAFEGAVAAATWEGEMVVAPFWSNTQVLWYRKSFVEDAGIDMSQPVTWDQIIEVASDNNGTVAVQANKYEGYTVWINALIHGAGGSIISNAEAGADADITIDSEAGLAAAAVIEKLAESPAAPANLSVSNEGTAAATFASDTGAFMVNWTYIWNNYGEDRLGPEGGEGDIGYARYPRTVQDEPSRPPYGGIGIGVSAFSEHTDLAIDALSCLTSPENQGVNAEITGNMPSSAAGYDYPPLAEIYPPELLELFQESVEAAAPRTPTPYWSDISSAIQSTWHPPSSVDEDTPQESAEYIDAVLHGRRLL